MSGLGISSDLSSWISLSDLQWDALLLGNGFSINIWEGFDYRSLLGVAKQAFLNPHLHERSIGLFERLDTCNFEDVLRVLYHAMLVDAQIGSPQDLEIQTLYENTKNSLSASISFAHVPPRFQGLESINMALSNYKQVFTTNYDLIPYWAIMIDNSRFRDFFWSYDNSFDSKDVGVPQWATCIYYLHGAVHLVECPNGTTRKLVGGGFESLGELFDLNHPEQVPLIITEGSSSFKYSRIKRNEYLGFCFEEFSKLSGGLVVLGHSLHPSYDQHIVDAIRQSGIQRIAIGVWPGMGGLDVIAFKARMHRENPDVRLYFFNSQTHPLAEPRLNVDGDY
ncbi:DUF4917 family protein [Pseudomonas syringae]|uniref:DUF4917 family protein n=1 Tax=Pseudomonas syringae TaxID=317 RepID=UPI003204F388